MNVGSAGHCCGLIDFSGMNKGDGHPEPVEVVKFIAAKCCAGVKPARAYGGANGGTIIITERRRDGEKMVYPGTAKLAAYIREHKLGAFTSLKAAPNPVHNDQTHVKPSMWNPDWVAVKAWYEGNEFPKPKADTGRW